MSGAGYSKFFWSDWRSDPKLRTCSLAARGLWIDMLSLMAEAKPKGELRIGDVPMTIAQVATFIGSSLADVETAFSELEKAGVFSRNRYDVPYSRRMVRDEKKRVISEKNGRKGGNPKLSPKKGISNWDNPPLNQTLVYPVPATEKKTPLEGFSSSVATPKPGGSQSIGASQDTPEELERRRQKVEDAKRRIFDA